MTTVTTLRCQTVRAVYLVPGDMIVHDGDWWGVISVRLEPQKVPPKVVVWADRYPGGHKASLVLDADGWIPRVLNPGGGQS